MNHWIILLLIWFWGFPFLLTISVCSEDIHDWIYRDHREWFFHLSSKPLLYLQSPSHGQLHLSNIDQGPLNGYCYQQEIKIRVGDPLLTPEPDLVWVSHWYRYNGILPIKRSRQWNESTNQWGAWQ